MRIQDIERRILAQFAFGRPLGQFETYVLQKTIERSSKTEPTNRLKRMETTDIVPEADHIFIHHDQVFTEHDYVYVSAPVVVKDTDWDNGG